jgi:hypothetical protein
MKRDVMISETNSTPNQDGGAMTATAGWRAAIAPSRRGILAALGGGLTGHLIFGMSRSEAKGKGKRKKRKKARNRKQRELTTRADATCAGPRDDAFIVNGGTRLAQTFTATASGALVKVAIDLNNEHGSSGDYLLTVNKVDGSGVPTNDVLAVTFLAGVAVGVGETTAEFVFADPAIVKAATEYALVLTRLAGGVLSWLSRSGDVCAGRGFVNTNPSAPFEFKPGVDFIFTAFIKA